ncbi:hypothetical protein QYE76_020951 [Lolium multiflorum]|uniref:Uncharacterized protein n=1 Tax=Lolium multiflorum TaxID=4521 RepID=A0AAD8R9P3_LOLMU|nr:hypothetical protein QYE76_020951 [Lolium multiflorum]
MEQFTQTEFYQLGNGGGLVFEQDLTELSMFLGRSFPEFFRGHVNDQPGGQLQWVIIADLRGKLDPPMTDRIQFSLRENNWADGVARAMREALARLCGRVLPRIRGTRFFHLARHDSMGAPMDLSTHPELKHHVDHTDYMLCETYMQLDNSRAYANYIHLQMAQKDETIKIIAKERKTLRRENAKKDYTISRLRAKIASLKETIKTQEDQLKDLEGEGEGEDIKGDGYSYVSNNNNNEEEEEDDDLAFHPYVDGHVLPAKAHRRAVVKQHEEPGGFQGGSGPWSLDVVPNAPAHDRDGHLRCSRTEHWDAREWDFSIESEADEPRTIGEEDLRFLVDGELERVPDDLLSWEMDPSSDEEEEEAEESKKKTPPTRVPPAKRLRGRAQSDDDDDDEADEDAAASSQRRRARGSGRRRRDDEAMTSLRSGSSIGLIAVQ